MLKKHIKKNRLAILMWVFLYILFAMQILPQANLAEALLFPFCFVATTYPFTTYLCNTLLTNALKKRKIGLFLFQFIIVALIGGIFFASYMLLFSRLEHMGYFPISEYFSIDIFPAYFYLVFISAGVVINLCMCGIRFFEETTKLQKNLVESQLKILQEQINPHFTFNVLNHINYYIEKKDDLASTLLLKYSDILRYQLYSGNKKSVTLEEEIRFLKDFIDIETIRWEGNLDIYCTWKVEDTHKMISPLLLIPLIENAFKHVSRSTSEKGAITIDFLQEANSIQLEVKNTKSLLSKAKKDNASGLGIQNFKNRLDILYYNKYKFVTTNNENSYYSKLIISI